MLVQGIETVYMYILITSILCDGLFIFHELENTTDTQLITRHVRESLV